VVGQIAVINYQTLRRQVGWLTIIIHWAIGALVGVINVPKKFVCRDRGGGWQLTYGIYPSIIGVLR